MTDISYLQVDGIPILVLTVLLVNSRTKLPYSQNNKIFRLLIVLLIAGLAMDALSWVVNGRVGTGLLYAINIVMYLSSASVAFVWFVYVFSIAYDDESLLRSRKHLLIASIPELVFATAVITSPWTHAFFFIDGSGCYVRGDWYVPFYVLGYGYVLVASVLALIKRRRETFPQKRRRLLQLAMFLVPPFIGALLQLLIEGLALLPPSMALSVLLVYVSLQRDEISLDGLTGLNNRYNLDSVLEHRCSGEGRAHPWCLILIDLDDFKQINDTMGHVAGDEALRMTAHALKVVFGKENAYLARYGGDEFVVMYDCAAESDARRAIVEVRGALDALRDQKEWERPITFSAGYAWCGVESGARSETGNEDAQAAKALIARADASMYEDKVCHKTR